MNTTPRSRWPGHARPFHPFGLGLLMLLSALLLDLPLPALAAPGDLDPSFDGDGKVLTDFGAFEVANALAVQLDGKLVAAGTSFSSDVNVSVESDVVLARYNRDGSLDRRFGVAGKVVTDLGGRSQRINALVVQPNGKLVVAGGRFFDPASDLILVRYNVDGSLDPTFGVGGVAVIPSPAEARGLALQPDGKLVVVNQTSIFRMHGDGTRDESFDGNGAVLKRVFGGNGSIMLQRDGKLVTAGLALVCSGDFTCEQNLGLERFNPDGSPDASFGSGGLVITDFGEESEANALVLQADGKLVVAGQLDNDTGRRDRILARYQPDGSLDTSFGSGGVVVTDGGADNRGWRALVLQADGSLVAGGHVEGLNSLLVRHNPDGSPDTSFGSGGAVALSDLNIEQVAFQSDGKLVVGGFGCLGGDCDLALVRHVTTNESLAVPPACFGRPATILGTSGSDTLRGTRGPDIILGRGGNDTIRGLEGNDTICGGPGRDRLIGSEGNDRLFGEGGNDKLFGDTGKDRLNGGNGRDACRTGERARRCEGKPASSKPTSGERPKDPPKVPCPQVSTFPCS